jgi:hypothetical protein
MPWDEEDLNHQRVEKMVAEATIGTCHPQRGRPRDPFSPRPDRRRWVLPSVHRKVARWLRHKAVVW